MELSLVIAEIALVIGADISEGSTVDVKLDITEMSLSSSKRTRGFRAGSLRMPKRRAELNDRCKAAQDCFANTVKF
jgi:hypothetical protein